MHQMLAHQMRLSKRSSLSFFTYRNQALPLTFFKSHAPIAIEGLERRLSAGVLALALSLVAAACTSDGPLRFAGQQPVAAASNSVFPTGVKILASDSPAKINALSEVPYTYEVAVTDSLGRFLSGAQVVFGRSTGYIKARGATDATWRSAGDAALVTNALGRIAFRWHTGGESSARLIVDANQGYPGYLPGRGTFARSRDTLVSREIGNAGTPVRAEQVAPSGVHSVCYLQGGRVGCVGAVAEEHAAAWSLLRSIAVAAPRYLQFSAKPVALRSVTEGACALLETGFTSCWRSLGPAGTVFTSTGHQPFIEFSGRLARAADGTIYVMRWDATPTAAPEWMVMPTDSTIVSLFNNGGRVACGLARSKTVMCGFGVEPGGSPAPMKVAVANPLREVLVADGGAIHAGAGSTFGIGGETILLARRGVGQTLFSAFPSFVTKQTALAPSGVAADTLVAGDGTVRLCDRSLSDSCAGRTWTSVTRFGSVGEAPTSRDAVSPIYTRVCGIRDVVVCSWVSRAQSRRSFDTLRVMSP
jgi:hypothetical protein